MERETDKSGTAWREWLLRRRGDERYTRAKGARMVRGAALLSMGYLFSAAPLAFSVNPLSLSLLGASEVGVGYALVGVLLGLWTRGGEGALTYVAAALGIVLLRPLLRLYAAPSHGEKGADAKLRAAWRTYARARLGRLLSREGEEESEALSPPSGLYDEPLRLRLVATVPMAALVAFSLCARGDFSYYDLYGAVLMLLGAPLGVVLLRPALSAGARRTALSALLSEVLLLWALAYVGRTLVVFGLSPVVVLTVILTLWSARRYGLLYALLVAVSAGLGYDALCVPMYAVMGLLYALLSPLLGGVALVSALLVGMLYALLVGGVNMFWAIVPSLSVGVLIYTLPAHRRTHADELSRERQKHERERSELMHALISEQAVADRKEKRLSRMAGAFGSLGEVFSQLGERTADPDVPEARRLCHEVYDGYCQDCEQRARCWSELLEQTVSEIGELGRVVCEEGKAARTAVPPSLQGRCPHTDEVVEELNYRLSRRHVDEGRRQGSVAFAHACDTVSCLLRDLLRERDEPMSVRPHEKTREIEEYLRGKGMQARSVCITGQRCLCVHLSGLVPAALTVEADELRREIGKILGVPLSKPRFEGSDEGKVTMCALPPLRVDYAHRSLAARAGQGRMRSRSGVCGDTLRVFEGEAGYLFALLCDGMGNGHAAAVTSGCSAVLLERTLQAGVGIYTALRLLNHYLHARLSDAADESFSTVDLFCLDLYTGKGQFVKSGAAPSLILRGGRIYRLSSHTVPVGILHAIDAQSVPFEVKEGDHILLMSDGVSDSAPEVSDGEDVLCRCSADDWLSAFLSGEGPIKGAEDDEALIEQLFAMAREHGSRDDMSIISIRVRRAEELEQEGAGDVDKTGKM